MNMEKIFSYLLLTVVLFGLSSCSEDWLEREPEEILTDEQVWGDPDLINSTLANFYSRLPKHINFEWNGNCGNAVMNCGWMHYASYDEAMWSGVSNFDFELRNNITNYPYLRWSLWNYDLIRDINLAIENINKVDSPNLPDVLKEQFVAELRFLRAYNYFELVKRMGGVPIITEQLIYDFSGDPSSLQQPRNTEAEVYDFISDELDAITDQLGNASSITRANDWTARALKSRAMLYAGSIAKYNNEMSNPVTLPGEEVGIPVSRAEGYYEEALAAASEIINNGPYSLYANNDDPGENFYEAVSSKNNNNEVIMAVDYSVAQGLRHSFTQWTIPRGLREDVEGVAGSSAISPSLNLVEAFPNKDGSNGELQGVGDGTAGGQSDWIFYDNPEDLFAEKDPRLYGTIIYPGTSFAGNPLRMQAGIYEWTGSEYERIESTLNSRHTDGELLTGADGPQRNENYVSSTGFYLRKYLDPTSGAATSAVQSEMWFVLFRLGEVYLNAAEAAYELSRMGGSATADQAANYINSLRERAGFENSGMLNGAGLNAQIIRNERRVELAFEDHRVWDLKRWRIAHRLWDGTSGNPDANIYALFPYRIVHPGHPNHGKYVFDKFRSPRNNTPRFFRMGNYYSEIEQDVLDNNPELVRNPFH